jgi:hypothetical protein
MDSNEDVRAFGGRSFDQEAVGDQLGVGHGRRHDPAIAGGVVTGPGQTPPLRCFGRRLPAIDGRDGIEELD